MGALVGAEENVRQRVEESSPSLQNHIADPVVYKLVRVEGDGRLVPATDDEVMEVEDILGDEKGEVLPVFETAQVEGCLSSEECSSLKDNLENPEGILRENTQGDSEKLNARLEYIGVMLQKVKQEERLRLSSGCPDHSLDHSLEYLLVDGQCSDYQLSASDKKPQIEKSSQEAVRLLSPKLSDCRSKQLETVETYLKPTNGVSSASASCSSSLPGFSKIKGEICLDNLTIKELQETFKVTFGRDTSVKDKLWLKRRIAMGLTNSCDVETTTFCIKDYKLVKTKAEEGRGAMKSNDSVEQVSVAVNNNYKDPPASPANRMQDWQTISGNRWRRPEAVYEFNNEDIISEQTAAKRARKPTKRYIEELSEAETRECSERLVSSIKSSSHGQTAPRSRIRSGCDVDSDELGLVTRQLSLGWSGVQVPYVSRVRQGRRRENFMPLMKYHPSGIGTAAKLVKKSIGVCISQHDENGDREKARGPQNIQKQVLSETGKDKLDAVTSSGEQQQAEELENLDSFGDNSDNDATTVATTKGGTRRKHHRAWSLNEVIKLVEGVSRYGAGRWSEIKRVSFASHAYRTSVDLKDKWRNLLRASFLEAPKDKGMTSRKHASVPIPAPILSRVRELAERHTPAAIPVMSAGRFSGCSGKSSLETRSGYL